MDNVATVTHDKQYKQVELMGERGERHVDYILDAFEGLAPLLKVVMLLGTMTMNFFMGWALGSGHFVASLIMGVMAVCCDCALIYFVSRLKAMDDLSKWWKGGVYGWATFLFVLSLISSVGFGLWVETLVSTGAASQKAAIERKAEAVKYKLENLPGGQSANPDNTIDAQNRLIAYAEEMQMAELTTIEALGYAPELAIFHKLPLFKSDPELWATIVRLLFGIGVTVSPVLIGFIGCGDGRRARRDRGELNVVPIKKGKKSKPFWRR